MVIGYDTYHDSAQKGRSVGAVVASMNSTFTKYLSVANLHTNPAQVRFIITFDVLKLCHSFRN